MEPVLSETMRTNPTFNSNSLQEPTFRMHQTLLEVFQRFDEDGDGKISIEELKNFLGHLDIHEDDGEIEKFLHIDQNSKIEFSQSAQEVFEGKEDDNKFQNLIKMNSHEISLKLGPFNMVNEKPIKLIECVNIDVALRYFNQRQSMSGKERHGDAVISAKQPVKIYGLLRPINLSHFDGQDCLIADAFSHFDENRDGLIPAEELEICFRSLGLDMYNDHVIDMNHVDLVAASVPDENCSNISKLRDILFGLTGQAAVSFIAYSPTRPLYVIAAVNALAFLFLLISFCLRGSSKQKVAEKITGVIGISAAAAVFFMMMGVFFF